MARPGGGDLGAFRGPLRWTVLGVAAFPLASFLYRAIPNVANLGHSGLVVMFLIDALSADPDFTSPVSIPDGFIEASLSLSVPRGKGVYIKLRDDPTTVDTVVVPAIAQ